MIWRAHVRERLCHEAWVPFGELFEEIENHIPLHNAFRGAGRPNISIIGARLRLLKLYLYELKVVADPPRDYARFHYLDTRIGLPIAAKTVCSKCAGPLVMCAQRLYCRHCQVFIEPRPPRRLRPSERLARENRAFFTQLAERQAEPIKRPRGVAK